MIRPAEQEDVPQIIELLKLCNLYNPQLDYSEWSHPMLVMDASGVIVGMTQVILARPYAYMTEICVHPDWQNKGITSALLTEVESILKDCGISAWCGLATELNENSIDRMKHKGGIEFKRGVALMRYI